MSRTALSLAKRTRRRVCSFPDPDKEVIFNDADDVYDIDELLSMIAAYVDWYTLMALSRSGQGGRKAARYETRVRFRTLLKPYVGGTQFKAFLDMLDSSKAVVGGSVARQLLAINSTTTKTPFDLNIIVPRDGSDMCMAFFTSIGFSQFALSTPHMAYRKSVNIFGKAVKNVNGIATFVTVSVARDSVVHAVLSSPFTAQTNVISSTRVYSFFPNIITSPFGVKGDGALRGVPRPSLSFRVHPTNQEWKAPCGPCCVTLIRKTWGDKGVASFVYDGSYAVPETRYPGTDYMLAEKNILWRFSSRCRNLRCPFYAPSVRRHA